MGEAISDPTCRLKEERVIASIHDDHDLQQHATSVLRSWIHQTSFRSGAEAGELGQQGRSGLSSEWTQGPFVS